MTNTALLESKIKSSGFKDGFLARSCGITERTFYNKKKGKNVFNQDEILVLKTVLRLSETDIDVIFFDVPVDKTSTKEVANG